MNTVHETNAPLRLREFDETEPVTVSICTITFNHASFIAQCIEAFLDQRCDFRVEIIIYDDASDDGTADILRKYAERHPTIIKPILSDRNLFSLGVNPYYAFVFPNACGEFIAICDGDDYWTEHGKLAKQVRVLRSDPNIAITYGKAFRDLGGGETVEFTEALDRDLSSLELKSCPAINTASTCFRNLYLDSPPQFLRYSPVGDLTVWSIVGGLGSGRFMENLAPVGYRIHGGGIYSTIDHDRKYYMSSIAKFCVAAYHDQNNDSAAARRVLAKAVFGAIARLGLRNVALFTIKAAVSRLLLVMRRRSSVIDAVLNRLRQSRMARRDD